MVKPRQPRLARSRTAQTSEVQLCSPGCGCCTTCAGRCSTRRHPWPEPVTRPRKPGRSGPAVPDRTTVTVTAPTTGPGPWRYASVTPSCQRCGAALRSGRSRRFCGSACRQAAYRDRRAASRPTAAPLPALPPRTSRTSTGVYECPGCGQRLAAERRCPDCQLFARRIGDGGSCTGCGEVLTVTELLGLE